MIVLPAAAALSAQGVGHCPRIPAPPSPTPRPPTALPTLLPPQVRRIQWFPGHIAKAERELREQLAAVDVVFEVRDGRIPMSTRHPQIPAWVGSKPRLLIINREDMVAPADRAAWARFFSERGQAAQWTNGTQGEGVAAVTARALEVSEALNAKRAARGLRPRPVRAVVIGFPNVGKSALINRLLGRRMVDSAPRPGVTRVLRWVRIGGELDLLDAPGIIPMSLRDQSAAQRLAMCNDIGEAAYVASLAAAALLRTLKGLPGGGRLVQRVEDRYRMPPGSLAGGLVGLLSVWGTGGPLRRVRVCGVCWWRG